MTRIADGSEIYWDGRHYDAFNKPHEDDLPFYLSECRRVRGPVLELACGTGRLAIPLKKAGVDVTGMDLSSPMLEQARRKAVSAGVKIRFMKGNAASFRSGRRYGLVFMAFNSMQHLAGHRELAGLFASVRRCLAPGGRFIFDVFNPDPRYLMRDPDEMLPVAYYEDPSGEGKILVNEQYSYDKAAQVSRITWYFRKEKNGKTHKKAVNLRCFYPEELLSLVRYNGFRVLKRYGNFKKGRFGGDSRNQVLVCSPL